MLVMVMMLKLKASYLSGASITVYDAEGQYSHANEPFHHHHEIKSQPIRREVGARAHP